MSSTLPTTQSPKHLQTFLHNTWMPISAYLLDVLGFFLHPITLFRKYKLGNLQSDAMAGLTVAIVMLPQAIAFALIAELPPQVGLYSAIVGSIVGGLWGSSNQLQTGPTNTTSLLILSILLGISAPDKPEYVILAGLMAFLVGLIRLAMGLARLGVIVNFVSDSVIVGFTSGAGILILINQIRHLLRLNIPSAPGLWQTLPMIINNLPTTHIASLIIGVGAICLIVIFKKINPKLPGPLIVMVVASVIVALLGLDARGMRVVGELPKGFPPLAKLPLFDFETMGKLLTGSLAVAAIGLVEAMSIARSIASQTGQRIDSNQEFVSQGLANIACAFLSGYASSGSFTRSAVNFEAGAKTGLASVIAGLAVLIAMIAFAPLAAYIPLPALAGVLILTAWGLVNREKMARVWQSSKGDRAIMVLTMLATLVLPLQFAVLTGIVTSLVYYLVKTSTPRVLTVVPDNTFRHFVHQPERHECTQLGIIEIRGDLYFGATNHVEQTVIEHAKRYPDQRFLLLRLQAVEHCDISGIHMLESIVRAWRDQGHDVYLCRVREAVQEIMDSSSFTKYLGQDHFLDQDNAIEHLFYRVLDPAICIYECPIRAFSECQNLPKRHYPNQVKLDIKVPKQGVPFIEPAALWSALKSANPPIVIDVREPREFRRGHIPDAKHIPLAVLATHTEQISDHESVVMVCRGGHRSERATALFIDQGFDKIMMLKGGMIAWEKAKLLEAIDE